ncbi:hypothetical protein B0J17DRAFT_662391 [Rhizoctonia solani]|nr:hypothetical protein B0J17DRAFT_662391 [Rhizoctonia solani]
MALLLLFILALVFPFNGFHEYMKSVLIGPPKGVVNENFYELGVTVISLDRLDSVHVIPEAGPEPLGFDSFILATGCVRGPRSWRGANGI